MRNLLNIVLICTLLSACSEQKQALDTWVHADTGSYSAAISPDGKHLLTAEINGFGRVWDLQTHQVQCAARRGQRGRYCCGRVFCLR
jgi:WD40 repeat protein